MQQGHVPGLVVMVVIADGGHGNGKWMCDADPGYNYGMGRAGHDSSHGKWW